MDALLAEVARSAHRHHGDGEVFGDGHVGLKVEELEDETDALVAKFSNSLAGYGVEVFAVDNDSAAAGTVNTTENM